MFSGLVIKRVVRNRPIPTKSGIPKISPRLIGEIDFRALFLVRFLIFLISFFLLQFHPRDHTKGIFII